MRYGSIITLGALALFSIGATAFAYELPGQSSLPAAPVSQFINSLQQISVPTVQLPSISTGNIMPNSLGTGLLTRFIDSISHLTLGQVFEFLKGIALRAINIIVAIIPRLVDLVSSLFKLK